MIHSTMHVRFLTWIMIPALLNVMASCNSSSTLKEDTDGQSLLWRIEGKNLKQPSYLFGTMHMIPEESFEFGENLTRVAESVDAIVLEIDMDDLNQLDLMASTMLPGGKSISDFMDSASYARLKSLFIDTLHTSPIKWFAYSKLKPFFLISEMASLMMGQTKSYEREFMAIAEEKDIEILGLEEATEQLAFIDSIPLEDQVEILVESFDQYDTMKIYLNRMIAFYQAEELDSIEALMNDPEFMEMMEFEDLLLTDRNKRWIVSMGDMMEEGGMLFAVGAGHLPGEEGVINLLRQAGYTVTAIESD